MEYPCCVLGSADSHITPSHGSAEGGAIFFPHSYDDDDVGDDGDDGDAGDDEMGMMVMMMFSFVQGPQST